MIDVVIRWSSKFAKLQTGLVLNIHVSRHQIVENWVVFSVLICIEIRTGWYFATSTGELTTTHDFDVFRSREKI